MRMTDIGKHTLKKGAAKYLALAFALVFLVFQSSTLVHSHAGDLNKHLDCTFCLKIGAGDHAIPANPSLFFVAATSLPYSVVPQSFAEVSALTPRSRSPPL